MPYDQLEEIGARRHEKVALYLTFENAVGLIAGALPAYIALAHGPGLLRIGLTALCGIAGVIMTLDVAGLPIYARMLWRMRGIIRIRTRSTLITPDDLSGTPLQVSTGHARALRVGGTIQVAREPALPAQPPTLLHPRVATDLPPPDAYSHPARVPRPLVSEPATAPVDHLTNPATTDTERLPYEEVSA